MKKIRIKFIQEYHLVNRGRLKPGREMNVYQQEDKSVVVNIGCCGSVNLVTIPPEVFEII